MDSSKSSPRNMDLELNLRILRCLGMWPCAEGAFSGLRAVVGAGARTWVLVMLGTQICTQVGAVLHLWGDLHLVAMNACLMLTFMSGLFKVSMFLMLQPRVINLVAAMEDNLSRYAQQERRRQTEVLARSAARAKEVSLTFLIVGAFALGLFIFTPLLKNYLEILHESGNSTFPIAKNLPTPAWFPFDPTVSPLYEVSYVYQAASIFVVYISTSTLDNLYVSLIIFIGGQLKILNTSLTNICDNAKRNVATNEPHSIQAKLVDDSIMRRLSYAISASPNRHGMTEDVVSELSDTRHRLSARMNTKNYLDRINVEMEACLVDCIQYHQSIIRCVKELELVIGPAVLAQFLTSMIVICLTAFVVSVTMSNASALSTYVLYLATMFYELFMYCWYGNDLLVESEELQLAAYGCGWPDASRRFKSSVRIVMARAQKPLKITAGKFYAISRETFLMLLNGSYTYFAVLRQVNDR